MSEDLVYRELVEFRQETRARFDKLEVKVDHLESARDRSYWPRRILTVCILAIVSTGVSAAVASLVAGA